MLLGRSEVDRQVKSEGGCDAAKPIDADVWIASFQARRSRGAHVCARCDIPQGHAGERPGIAQLITNRDRVPVRLKPGRERNALVRWDANVVVTHHRVEGGVLHRLARQLACVRRTS